MTGEEVRSVYVGARITETVYAQLEETARHEGLTKSAIISIALERYLEK